MTAIKNFFRELKIQHYVVFGIVAAIGIFNAVTALSPIIRQSNRERNIEKTFNSWWEEEGAAQFAAVGLSPDEKLKAEEFAQYREKYLAQNHTFIVEDRVAEMRNEFREWWETKGGKEQFIQDHKIYPDETHFENEYKKWVKKYTDKHLRYRLAYVPKDMEYDRMLTSWVLSPSVPSFLIFAFFFGFAFLQLSNRWGAVIALAPFALLAVSGGFFAEILVGTSFFDHYANERYMGASIGLAFMLGATAFGLRKDSVSTPVRAAAFAGFFLDVLTNWFFNPGMYGAVALISIACFGLGVLGGIKIPQRRKSVEEQKAEALEERIRQSAQRNPIAERKKKTRAMIDEGFQEAAKAHYEAAQRILSQALGNLLQEYPLDVETLKKLAERMASPNLFIDVSSAQWLEWGETAKARNCPEAALTLLEKGLSSEKNETLARRALYNIGEIRINNKLNMEEGVARLKKVIALGDKDILAMQARKMLEKIEK